jgi:hypothetical protein
MSTGRKWQDSKEKPLKSGKWTEKELNHLKRLLCKYANRKNLSPEQLSSLCSDSTPSGFEGIWTRLASYFPSRSVQSVHNACKRYFNPNNYKGTWSIEEERTLIEFVNSNGQKWKDLGDLLSRTSSNVKDKWKQMGGKHNELRKRGTWSAIETKEVELVSVENEDFCVNQLLALIRKNKKKLDDAEISWNSISDVFKTRSSVDCRTRWDHIIHTKFPESKIFTQEDDIFLFSSVKAQKVTKLEKVDFSMINNGKNEEDNRSRFKILSKAMSGRLKLSLDEVLNRLEDSYKQVARKEDSSIIDYYNSHYK